MMNKVFDYLNKPSVYSQGTSRFWDDEHISKGMLASHLDPGGGASRPHEFIDRSADWIESIAPADSFKHALDLGCGPGLYTERLYDKGYDVTGIDFSRRSIAYAAQKANEGKKAIEYIYMNYLDMDYTEQFDLVTLIYCDYGALSDKQRECLLNKVYKGMKKGGRFVFDVNTPKLYQDKAETKSWHINEGSGFWKPDTYLCLYAHFLYENNIRMDQYVIFDQGDNVDIVRTWDSCFTKETIAEELSKAGFADIEIYSDVAGTPYGEESTTLCVVAEK